MPLITCPECMKSVSDSAESCPHCGYPIHKSLEDNRNIIPTVSLRNENDTETLKENVKRKVSKKALLISIGIAVFVLVLAVIYFSVFYLTGDERALIDSVSDKIDAIGSVTIEKEAMVIAAENEYNALDQRIQGHVSNRDSLLSARQQIEQLFANDVIGKIAAIGEVTLNSGTQIEDADKAYENLSENRKKLVDNYQTLIVASTALSELQLQNVIDLIDKIGVVSLQSHEQLLLAREAYENLTTEQKDNVNNYITLTQGEVEYSQLAVSNTIALIDALGTITLESENAVNSAEDAYAGLNNEEKVQVTNYSLLSDAKGALDNLIEQKKIQEKTEQLRSIIRVTRISCSRPNSAGGVNVFLNFVNNSVKTVKYLYFTVVPYNAVGDMAASEIGNKTYARCEATGPYEPGEGLSGTYWRWENLWYNSTIVKVELTKLEIEYTDGTTVTIDQNDVGLVIY